jgi:hypothetical protein
MPFRDKLYVLFFLFLLGLPINSRAHCISEVPDVTKKTEHIDCKLTIKDKGDLPNTEVHWSFHFPLSPGQCAHFCEVYQQIRKETREGASHWKGKTNAKDTLIPRNHNSGKTAFGYFDHMPSPEEIKASGLPGPEVIDNSGGPIAFLDLEPFGFKRGGRNFDIGGGADDINTTILRVRFDIQNRVYDPFNRPDAHNAWVLEEAEKKPFDSATSMSVLNVIDTPAEREKHILLTRKYLRDDGRAFFKVWRGNGKEKEERRAGHYYSHKGAESYVGEVEAVYGKGNVELHKELNLIVAIKRGKK